MGTGASVALSAEKEVEIYRVSRDISIQISGSSRQTINQAVVGAAPYMPALFASWYQKLQAEYEECHKTETEDEAVLYERLRKKFHELTAKPGEPSEAVQKLNRTASVQASEDGSEGGQSRTNLTRPQSSNEASPSVPLCRHGALDSPSCPLFCRCRGARDPSGRRGALPGPG